MISGVPIYLIRHGQTDWNAEGRFQGQRDIPLNDTGRLQATGNGELLNAVIGPTSGAFDFVSSPMIRTRQTMELLRGAMGLDPGAYRTDSALIELSFGDWEGHTLNELAELFPEALSRREGDKWNFLPPGEHAESYEILSWRVSGWLDAVSKPTVCVTHGGVMRSVLKLWGGRSPTEASETNVPQDRILKLQGSELRWIDRPE
jgi:broad specificity phosphatase PhoE